MKNYARFLLAFSLVLFCSYVSFAQAPAPPPAPEAPPALTAPEIILNPEVKLIDEAGAGKLYQVGPHLVCVMEGSPDEMGRQHGRLLAKQIRYMLKEGYVKKSLYDRGYTREYIDAQSDIMEKHFPAEYVEEMKGIVQGLKDAGVDDVDYNEIRLGATQAELLHHPPNEPPVLSNVAKAEELPHSCSNFAAWGKWTVDGRLLHGRNLDWPISNHAQDGAVVLVWRPRGGTPFMMVGWAGGVGSVTGMNSRGLTCGEMTLISSRETFDGLPLLLMVRRMLESAGNIDEAVSIMKTGPRTIGWNYVLGDGKVPEARALEVDADDCTVFTAMDPKENADTGHWAMEDAVRRTNHPCGMTQIGKLIDRFGAKYGVTRDNLQMAIPLLKLQNTWQRYDWLGKRIQEQPGKMDVTRAIQLLCNGPVKNSGTLHSVVFDPKNQSIYLAIASIDPPVTATETPFVKIDFTPWFK